MYDQPVNHRDQCMDDMPIQRRRHGGYPTAPPARLPVLGTRRATSSSRGTRGLAPRQLEPFVVEQGQPNRRGLAPLPASAAALSWNTHAVLALPPLNAAATEPEHAHAAERLRTNERLMPMRQRRPAQPACTTQRRETPASGRTGSAGRSEQWVLPRAVRPDDAERFSHLVPSANPNVLGAFYDRAVEPPTPARGWGASVLH
jgi:hypothetical protein